MLPDFVALKRQIVADRTGELRSAERRGIASLAGHVRQHEGDRFTVVREDQSVHTSRYKEVELSATLKASDLLSKGTTAIRDMMSELTDALEKEQTQTFEAVMKQATDEAGTATHAGGRPITAELIIETFEKMEFSFEDDGTWNMPTVVLHPAQEARARHELSRLDTDPVLNKRMKALVEKKREAWRVRETNRTLVD
jgi:hypothetical protein